MHKHRHWTDLWWAILRHFGRECKKAWGGEVVAVAVGGIAGAATAYLRTRGHISFTDAVIDGLISAGLFLAMYLLGHLLRSPWLERKSEGLPPTLRDGIFGAVMLMLLLGGSIFVCYLVGEDLQSELTLHSVADVDGKKSADFITLETCKANYAALTKPEPKDSLRRRTIQLVDDLSLFWSRIPMPPQQSVQNPANDDERKRNEAWAEYWRKTTVAYTSKDFNHRILGIVREYKDKGVPVGFLEASAEQPDRLIGAAPYGGFSLERCEAYQNELCQLRELAFHVDAADKRIGPDF